VASPRIRGLLPSKTSFVATVSTFWRACQDLAAHQRPDALLVVGAGVALWGTATKEALHPLSPEAVYQLVRLASPEHGLLVYLLGLFDALGHQEPPPLDLFRYANAGGPSPAAGRRPAEGRTGTAEQAGVRPALRLGPTGCPTSRYAGRRSRSTVRRTISRTATSSSPMSRAMPSLR
jgi:hypothetical protein